MNELTELATTILAHLEEAHAENVPSTINTVIPIVGGSEEVSNAQSALLLLNDLDYVRIAYEDRKTGKYVPVSKEQSIRDIDTIVDRIHFSPSEGTWEWDRNFPMMQILTTPTGLARSREILSDPTFAWWWEKS